MGEEDIYEGEEFRKVEYEAYIDRDNLYPTHLIRSEIGGKGLLLGKKITPLHFNISPNPH